MLCKVCGAQIPDNATECEFCGAKVSGENVDNEEIFDGISDETRVIDSEEIKQMASENEVDDIADESQENEESGEIFDDNERRRREQMKKMIEDKKQQLSEIERRRNEKRQRQKRNKVLLIGLICALAVAAAGIGVYYVAQNVGTPAVVDETPAPTISATAAVMPSASPTVAPSPELSMTTSPREEAASSGNSSNNQSWTATGNGGSSSGRTNTASSGGSSSSASGTTSGGGTSVSSGTGASSALSSGGSASSGGGTTSGSSSSGGAISNSGASSNTISSQLATGGEVIYNTGTGRYLMTFVVGNTRYYANVSAGSTTEQVHNKPYTVTAEPTSEKYNGNTVYEITTLTKYDGDYLLANSGTKLLTDSDIKGMSKYDLALARNEIYARHGRKFQTAEYHNYFSSKSWYSINPNYNYSDDNSNLNEIEAKNVEFLLNAERK
ncbi:MAG: YARHG domain-containing protein [Hominilimicola sp.]